MKENYMEIADSDKARILSDADRMLEGYYHFCGIWDMEPCAEYVNNQKTRWDIRYNGDAEWSFMFTRMGFLYRLFLAAMLSGDRVYIAHGLKLIKKWYADNRIFLLGKAGKLADRVIKVNNLAHRTLDVAILTANLTDFIIYCADRKLISVRDFHVCRKIAITNVKYIYESDNGFKSFSNWGIIENACALYSMHKLEFALNPGEICQRLHKQIYNQILSWGYQIESSPMYLVQILLYLLAVMHDRKAPFCDLLREPVICACKYIASIRTPSGSIPNIGDSDQTNISDIMTAAAEVLDMEDFYQYATREPDMEFRYKFRLWGRHYPGSCAGETEKSGYTAYPNQVVYRDGNTYFICSNTARAQSGHKHYDYLSIIYYAKGVPLLTDLGRYTYVNGEERAFYVGPYAHNTIAKGSAAYYQYLNCFETIQHVECEKTELQSRGGYHTVRMRCRFGYGEAVVTRYVTFLKGYGLIITDAVTDQSDENYTEIFNIGESLDIIEGSDKIIMKDAENTFYYRNDKNIRVRIRSVFRSDRYNEKRPARQMLMHMKKGMVTHVFSEADEKPDVTYLGSAVIYTMAGGEVKIRVDGK